MKPHIITNIGIRWSKDTIPIHNVVKPIKTTLNENQKWVISLNEHVIGNKDKQLDAVKAVVNQWKVT